MKILSRIINSKGINKEEMQSRVRLTFSTIATQGNEKQTGRVSPGWQQGYEVIENYPLKEKAKSCCDQAIRMVSAGYAPSGMMPVILCNGFGGVIFHEACGQLGSNVGWNRNSCFKDVLLSNRFFLRLAQIMLDYEWGSYYTEGCNDSSDLLLIENGICRNYLVDELGSRRMGMPVTGCSRRQDYSYAPTSRMSNIY